MSSSAEFLNPSRAAQRLGVSVKALRLYERRGLLFPIRSESGWRAYGPAEMACAAEIVTLRALGLSLAQVARVLGGDPLGLEPALAAHQAVLEARIRGLADTLDRLRGLRAGLARGDAPNPRELAGLLRPAAGPGVVPVIAFDLPWPWGGERLEMSDTRAINYIIGSLGSGKTRLARCLADSIPGAAFLDLERNAVGAADPAAIAASLAWLAEDGATESPALAALIAALESDGPTALVVDMVEQGLDQASQEALIAHLRRRVPGRRPLFLLTRSNAILDMAAMGPDEAVWLCPANHSPPSRVAPWPGAPGRDSVATCLASPAVRARTEGVVAIRSSDRPQIA